jgi:hypothetical protein
MLDFMVVAFEGGEEKDKRRGRSRFGVVVNNGNTLFVCARARANNRAFCL